VASYSETVTDDHILAAEKALYRTRMVIRARQSELEETNASKGEVSEIAGNLATLHSSLWAPRAHQEASYPQYSTPIPRLRVCKLTALYFIFH
jgi:hypothetical protein